MSKRFTIYRIDSGGKREFYDDAFNKREADKKAKVAFEERLDRDSFVEVEKQEVVTRLKSDKIGFRKCNAKR